MVYSYWTNEIFFQNILINSSNSLLPLSPNFSPNLVFALYIEFSLIEKISAIALLSTPSRN